MDNEDLYSRAGISDVGEFYLSKFASDEVLDARYFRALDRFDIRFARTMWVYDNVRSGSDVLDLGCGAGMLALLKRKGVTLTGIDLSPECALAARRNGYDATFSGALSSLPFDDKTFDYVVSLDVLGHIESKEKDAVLAEVKRVLRADGVTLHGIEAMDRAAQKNYDEMSAEELHRFIEIDGHVGLEEEQEHGARFQRFFAHVAWEPRYALCLSSEEFLKQAERYGLPFEDDFLEYLRGLSFSERRAFDMAMGYVFAKISDLNIHLPKAGLYVLLKASDAPLGPFYNEHRDRHALFARPGIPKLGDEQQKLIVLDRHSDVVFDDGWYEPNNLPPVARWMRRQARINFPAQSISEINLDLTTHLPDLASRPLGLEFLLNGQRLCAFSLAKYGWMNLRIPVSPELATAGTFQFEVLADRTWRPRPTKDETRDDREISIAICNITIAA